MPATPRIVHRCSEAVAGDDEVEADELGFHFLAGRLSLDLVATIGERWHRRFERLRTPGDLGRWAVEAGLIRSAPAVTESDLAVARRLRGAIARVVMAWGCGEALDGDDVATINAAAAAPDLAPTLGRDGHLAPGPDGGIRAVLSAVARDAIDLVAAGDPARLRECAAEDCALLFSDASRPGTRRWCSMEACGNRHKTTQYRRRRASSGDPGRAGR